MRTLVILSRQVGHKENGLIWNHYPKRLSSFQTANEVTYVF